MKNMKRVIFHPIKKNHEKIPYLVRLVHQYFHLNHFLDILTSDLASKTKIDELLWKYPKNSFLPHTTEAKSSYLIKIYTKEETIHPAHTCLNLSLKPLSPTSAYQTILEFDDQSSKQKKESSKIKYQFYKENGYKIATLYS